MVFADCCAVLVFDFDLFILAVVDKLAVFGVELCVAGIVERITDQLVRRGIDCRIANGGLASCSVMLFSAESTVIESSESEVVEDDGVFVAHDLGRGMRAATGSESSKTTA